MRALTVGIGIILVVLGSGGQWTAAIISGVLGCLATGVLVSLRLVES